MIYLIFVLGMILIALLFWPFWFSTETQTPEDVRRSELEEEKTLLIRNLQELIQQNKTVQDEAQQQQSNQADIMREKVRLAQVLQQLEQLGQPEQPPSSAKTPLVGDDNDKGSDKKQNLPATLFILLGIGGLLVVGTYTFLDDWRMSGLPKTEAAQLENAMRLPQLQKAAAKSKSQQDLLALGEAAWQAKKYQLAAQAYTTVLTQQRDHAEALRRTGFFLLQNKAMAANGLKFIARSVQLDPQDPEGPLMYGYALGMFGQFEAGLKQLRQHQKLAPDSKEADDLVIEFQQRSGQKVTGALVYSQNCAACHGKNGEGGTAQKILGSAALHNNEALTNLILNGTMSMPAFPQLKGQQLSALLEHLKTF